MNALSATVWFFVSGHDWTTPFAATAVKSVLVLCAAWLLLRFWRNTSAAMRHWVWLLALTSLFFLPLRSTKLPGWSVPLWSRSANIESKNELASVTGELKGDASATLREREQVQALAPAGKIKDTKAGRSTGRARGAFNLSSALFLAWLAGLSILLGRIALAQWSVRRLEKTTASVNEPDLLAALDRAREQIGLRRPVRLLEGPRSLSPMTWRSWQPVVMLPEEAKAWSAERLQIVLRHELAHVKRWDCLTQLVAQFACAFFWFNPLVWLVARQMRIERERACDDLVLNAGATPSSYAEHLLEIARSFSVGSLASNAAIAMARPLQIGERIVAIVDQKRNRRRVTFLMSVVTILLAGAFLGVLSLCRLQAQQGEESKAKDFSAKFSHLKPYFAAKEKQARVLAGQETNAVSPDIWRYFDAVAKDDWKSATNLYWEMRLRCSQFYNVTNADPGLNTMAWQPVNETYGILEQFAFGEEKYVRAYGNDIINAIPPGSIYFGGTDSGRWLITGMSRSHENADPFFTLTQNLLTHDPYLNYARSMYGGRIYIPAGTETEAARNEYMADAQLRLSKGQLRPGEDVKIVDGKVKTSGQVGVMAINALIAKRIFDGNPEREFYVEESFPLDWMYPHLTPHGLILKINRQRLPQISDDVRQKDHDYWSRYVTPLIGDWLKDDTSVAEICRRAEKVHAEKDFSAYSGDPKFVANDYACRMFSKLRASIGGVYAWRAMQSLHDPIEKARMVKEADFAFRQAYALCPYTAEPLYHYVQLLAGVQRFDDALILARTSSKVNPKNTGLHRLIQELERMQRAASGAKADAELKTSEAQSPAISAPSSAITKLARKYVAQVDRTSEELAIADGLIAKPNATVDEINIAAQIYQQTGNYPKLETALARWVRLTPTPEAWLDYAASQAVQKKEGEALASLQQALTLNAARLSQDPKANDIQKDLRTDARFFLLHANTDFQKWIAPRR